MFNNNELLTALYNNNIDNYLNKHDYEENLVQQDLGMINLTSGKIVACDPLCLFESEPFTKIVKSGQYPVKIHVLNIATDKRVAFAEIIFSEQKPVQFELALVAEQDINNLGDGEFYGYGVDSGTGCFMDSDSYPVLDKLTQKAIDEAGIYTYPPLEDALEKSYIYTYSIANILLGETEHNVVAFSTGYGDGAYATYWGMSESGEICSLITDFGIIDTDNN